jgi:hypothetical protein
MQARVLLAAAVISSLYLAACESSSTGLSVPGSREEIVATLTSKQWMRAALTINPGYDILDNGHVVTNLYATEQACGKDNVLTFTSDGSWTEDEGPTKCDASDPQTTYGDWSLNATSDSMTISSDEGPLTAKIANLNASTLSLSAASDNWPDGVTRVEQWTWRAK